MEFRVKLVAPDLGVIEEAVRAADPAALVDVDPVDRTLRVTAWVDADDLAALLTQAGYPVTLQHIHQVPSICCGGCSG